MFFPNLITKICLIFSLMIDAYEITPIATERTTKYSGINLPRYTIQWTDADVDTEEKRVEWLSTTLASVADDASVDDIKREIACYPGPPLSSQMISSMDGMIPCDIFEDYINKTITEGKDLAQILRLNSTQIDWNNSIAENVLNMKTRLQSVRDSFPQITDASTTNNLRDLNYQFALLSSEIPSEQYNAVQDRVEKMKIHLAEKLSTGGINETGIASLLTKPNVFNFTLPIQRNFTALNGTVSKFPWFPRNHTLVMPELGDSTILPPLPLNNLTEISKRFRNFSMPAKLDPYYDQMVELAEQNKTSELKSLVQDVLQIPEQENPLNTLINLFKGRVSTAGPSKASTTSPADRKTISEKLSSKISEVISSDQMNDIRTKLKTALESI